MNKRHAGFTLIELMIVISIIGTLAAIALPNYQQYNNRAQITEGLALIDPLKLAIQEHYKDSGNFPLDNQSAGLPPADKLLGNYVQEIRIEQGAIHIRYGHYVNMALHDQILTLRPIVVTDSPASPMSWTCGYREPPPGMQAVGENHTTVDRTILPPSCRGRT